MYCENIFTSISPFYNLIKPFGLACYNLNLKTGKITLRWINYLMLLLSLIWCQYMTYLSFTESQYPLGSSIISRGWKLHWMLEVILTIPIILFNFLKRKHFEKFLILLHEFDELIKQFNWKYHINHAKGRNVLMLTMFLRFCFICFLIVYVFTNILLFISYFEILRFIIFLYINETYVLISSQFIFSAYCIVSRFKVLNENIR